MKKILLTMAIAAMGLGACDDPRPAPLTIDNRLTDEEIAAELADTMQMCGAHSLAEIDRNMVR